MLLKLPKKFRKNRTKKAQDEKDNVKSKPTDEDAQFGFNETGRSVAKSTDKSSESSSSPSSPASRQNTAASIQNTAASIQNTAASRQNTAASRQNTAASRQNTAASRQNTAASRQNTAASRQNTAASRQNTAASRQNTTASRQNPAASRQNPAASRQNPAASRLGTKPPPYKDCRENSSFPTSSAPYPSSRLPQQRSDKGPQRVHSTRTNRSTVSSNGTIQKRQNSAPPRRQNESSFEFSIKPNKENKDYFSNGLPAEHKPPALSTHRVQRNNSMVKLNSWVQLQKQKQNSMQQLNQSRHPQAAPRNPARVAPFSSKRYKPALYTDYMDPCDVASSIMSVPPMYRGKVMTLPRPRSSQEVNGKSPQRQRVPNSKSVSYLPPSKHQAPTITKSKSAHTLPHDGARVSHTNHPNILISPDSHTSPASTYSDVFSPPTSGRHDNRRFKYDVTTKTRTPSFYAAISPLSNSSGAAQVPTPAEQPRKQTLSNGSGSIHKDMETFDVNEDDIETNLKRLNELDQTLQQLSTQMQSLLKDKQRLENSLQKAKPNFSMGVGSEFELEENLSRVKARLSSSSKKLKEMEKENEDFENEIRSMKVKLLEKLNRKIESQSNQRQLEWELGRVQFIMEGVNKNKVGLVNNMQSLKDDHQVADLSLTSSTKASDTTRTTKPEQVTRSPRDVKRTSSGRRSSSGTLQRAKVSFAPTDSEGEKYFTLPGRKVSHATSVDSLTAAQIARFTQPTSLRPGNLHRTKSAAERLFSGSHGNLIGYQDPDEIKKIQREINQNRRRTLTGDSSRRANASQSFTHHNTHMKVGIDVQMAIKHHKMPKVLQRAKRDMQRVEAERQPPKRDYAYEFHDERLQPDAQQPDRVISDEVANDRRLPDREGDVESREFYVDVNLTHQLITPDKIDIPDRSVKYEKAEPSRKQEKIQQEKVQAIENMLSRSGQTASHPNVHLAAALAAEVGSVTKAVTFQADHDKKFSSSLV